MSDFQLNGFVRSMFEGYRDARKDKHRDWQFQELEDTPFLFSSNYLNQMYDLADSKEEHESILEHLYKHGSLLDGIESYKKIEQKIIDRYYEPKKTKAKLYVFPGGKK